MVDGVHDCDTNGTVTVNTTSTRVVQVDVVAIDSESGLGHRGVLDETIPILLGYCCSPFEQSVVLAIIIFNIQERLAQRHMNLPTLYGAPCPCGMAIDTRDRILDVNSLTVGIINDFDVAFLFIDTWRPIIIHICIFDALPRTIIDLYFALGLLGDGIRDNRIIRNNYWFADCVL